jgi:hypothetical protein
MLEMSVLKISKKPLLSRFTDKYLLCCFCIFRARIACFKNYKISSRSSASGRISRRSAHMGARHGKQTESTKTMFEELEFSIPDKSGIQTPDSCPEYSAMPGSFLTGRE